MYPVYGSLWPLAPSISRMVSKDLIDASDKCVTYYFWLTVDTLDQVPKNHLTGMLLTSSSASLHAPT